MVHDKFTSETQIVLNNEVKNVIDHLKKKDLVFKGKINAPKGENDKNWVEREQLLFRSTDFGDDKDRALQKSDKSWTYFASDVAYHHNKINRGYDVSYQHTWSRSCWIYQKNYICCGSTFWY